MSRFMLCSSDFIITYTLYITEHYKTFFLQLKTSFWRSFNYSSISLNIVNLFIIYITCILGVVWNTLYIIKIYEKLLNIFLAAENIFLKVILLLINYFECCKTLYKCMFIMYVHVFKKYKFVFFQGVSTSLNEWFQ